MTKFSRGQVQHDLLDKTLTLEFDLIHCKRYTVYSVHTIVYFLFLVDMEVGKWEIDLMTSHLIFIFVFEIDKGFVF